VYKDELYLQNQSYHTIVEYATDCFLACALDRPHFVKVIRKKEKTPLIAMTTGNEYQIISDTAEEGKSMRATGYTDL